MPEALADQQVDDVPSQEPILPELFSDIEPHTTLQTCEPLTADLFFESADGFGDWRIIIGQKCNKDLRDARKKNPVMYEIIVRKLRYLSRPYPLGQTGEGI